MGNYLRRTPRNTQLCYGCKDGVISWQILTAYQGSWTRHLVEWMDEEHMASDELRAVQWEEVDYANLTADQLSRWDNEFFRFFLTTTKAELVEESFTRGMMIYPSNTIKDRLEDKQLAARGFYVEVEHPELGDTITYPGAPLILNEAPWRVYHRPPPHW